MWPWGTLSLPMAVVALVGLYSNTLRSYERTSTDLGNSANAHERFRHPARPRHLGEYVSYQESEASPTGGDEPPRPGRRKSGRSG
jgi:hypothetical protein